MRLFVRLVVRLELLSSAVFSSCHALVFFLVNQLVRLLDMTDG